MLRGEKVTLRAVGRNDSQLFLKWLNDWEILQYIFLYQPLTEIEEEKWIQELPDKRDCVAFIIELSETKIPIGAIILTQINFKNQNAEIQFFIGEKDYWAKGYGSDAVRLIVDYGFNQLNLRRIFSRVFVFNERSLKLHRKVGFQEEGQEREASFKDGQFHNIVRFGLLRKEWKK